MCTSVNSEDLLERLAFSETISEKGGHQGHELVRFPTGSLRLRVHRWLSSAGSPSKHEALSVDSRDIPPRLTEKGTRSGPPANPSRELHAGCVQLRSISVPSRPPAHHTCHALGTVSRPQALLRHVAQATEGKGTSLLPRDSSTCQGRPHSLSVFPGLLTQPQEPSRAVTNTCDNLASSKAQSSPAT